jgi:hypothetical protein
VEKAKQGDARCAEIVLSRCWPERKGRPIRVDLPKINGPADITRAISQVVKAVATGALTVDEGNMICGLLDTLRKAFETTELEALLRRLEESEP